MNTSGPSARKANIIAMKVALPLLVVLASLVLMVGAGKLAHADTTFTVNRLSDREDADITDDACDVQASQTGNQCTLRAAIQEANDTDGPDTIEFAIPDDRTNPEDDVKTIFPRSPLPHITDTVTIDGYTQRGSYPNTLPSGDDAVLNIELSGNGVSPGEGADGLALDDASDCVIRGLVINKFADAGIVVVGDSNEIEGNFLGTDPSGTGEDANFWGVRVGRGANNTIGGTSPEARNLISGNEQYGVYLESGAESTRLLGNYIGAGKRGGPLSNGTGVAFFGASNNTIGDGTAAGANRIVFNIFDGIVIEETNLPNDANGNRIARNSIFSNLGLGIDLEGNGPTANDGRGDEDDGPNTLQNKPNLTSATTTGSKITIQGTLTSSANDTFVIRFFSNRSGNEGQRFLGQKSVTTDDNGEVSFTRVQAVRIPEQQRITATATGPGGNTSEFSASEVVRR
jgi:CSLREA domain-containing protein